MDKQASFNFPDEPQVARPREPPVKVKASRESTSICAWCGVRMAATLMDRTPPVDNEIAWTGLELPAWLPVAKRPEGSMLLYHLGQRHLDQVGPYLRRMETEDIGAVAAEAYELVEGDETS